MKNEKFIEAFRRRFIEKFVQPPYDRFKNLSDTENILSRLLKIHNSLKEPSNLVINLLGLVTDKLTFTENEVLRDTFTRPNSTSSVYVFLFDPAFKDFQVQKRIISLLLNIWNYWQQHGLRASELLAWKKFSNKERDVAMKVWNFMSELSKKPTTIIDLIEEQNKDMEEKLKMKEQVTRCLETCCKYAANKDFYLDVLFRMETKLRSESLRSVEIPAEIQKLVPYTAKLNFVADLEAWKQFLVKSNIGKITRTRRNKRTN